MFIPALQLLKSLLHTQKSKYKIHDFSRLNRGGNYVFDPIAATGLGYMTGFGSTIKIGDYIMLEHNNDSYYQVESIDYYTEPSDMWIALLKKQSSSTFKMKESNFNLPRFWESSMEKEVKSYTVLK